jgi:hypothetical protein
MKGWIVLLCFVAFVYRGQEAKLRIISETDAGGDPDDEQSLVTHRISGSP